jgi:uncharacterized RDD family membrane protein YckC/Tfp pilus assembly major pilin PilA
MTCPRCGKESGADARYCVQCGQSLVAPSVAAAAATDETVHAGFWLRVAAVLVDCFVLGAGYMVLMVVASIASFGMLLGTEDPARAENAPWAYLLPWWVAWMALPWLYAALFESSARQATPGKLALRIKVTDLEGRRISFARATGRYFAEWLTGLTFGIGYVMAAFTQKRQALHDLIAGTLVVAANAEPARISGAPPAKPMGAPAIAGLVLLVVFVGLAPIGILAAIAIPAYQDYTARSQVSEGLMIAHDYKGAVQAAFESSGQWPADLTALEDRFSLVKQVNNSRYVEAIEVSNGTITITYGRAASPVIRDYLLSLRPHLTAAGGIAWQCGNAELPAGVDPELTPASGFGVTSLQDKHLPPACRTGFEPT